MDRITRALSVGRFATPERAEELRSAGVTHILNVSDAPNEVRPAAFGFREVEWIPLEDREPVQPKRLVEVLDRLHAMASEPEAHVYIHCIAGQVRSPTVLWLYLIACGVPALDAREWIADRSPDASPGSTRMIDDKIVRFAEQHGLARFRPLARPDVIVPFE